jgi:hypothetical protein
MPERNAPKFLDLEQRQQILVSTSFSSTYYRLHDGSIPYRLFHFILYLYYTAPCLLFVLCIVESLNFLASPLVHVNATPLLSICCTLSSC